MIFVHVAAPAAHDIASRIRQQRHGCRQPRRIPAVKRVQRHPVAALAQDGTAVGPDQEFARIAGSRVQRQLQTPNADSLRTLIHDLAVMQQSQGHGIKRLFAIAPGPPEFSVWHMKIHPAADKIGVLSDGKHAFAALAFQLQLKSIQRIRIGFVAVAQGQFRAAIGGNRPGGIIGFQNAGGLAFFQPYLPPHPCRQEPAHNIPAKGRSGHPQPLELTDFPIGAHCGHFRLSGGIDGGGNAHGQTVGLAVAQLIGYVKCMGDERIGAFAHHIIIQKHLRDVVQPFKHQHPSAAVWAGRRHEIPFKLPAIEFVLPKAINVFAIKGLGFLPGEAQVQFHSPGHLRGNLFPGLAQITWIARHVVGFRRVIQRPIAA